MVKAGMMDFLQALKESQCIISSLELMLLFVLLTVALLFRTVRTGLIVAYLFVYRWGWLFLRGSFGEEQYAYFLAYACFGFLVLLLSIASLWSARAED